MSKWYDQNYVKQIHSASMGAKPKVEVTFNVGDMVTFNDGKNPHPYAKMKANGTVRHVGSNGYLTVEISPLDRLSYVIRIPSESVTKFNILKALAEL